MNILSFTIRKLLAVVEWLRYHFVIKKLHSGPGYVIFALLALATSYATAVIDYKIGLAVVALFCIILIVILCLRYPHFGFYLTLALSGQLTLVARLANLSFNFPYGVPIEILTYLTLFGILFNPDLRKKLDSEFWTNPITISFLFLMAYNLIELFNPSMFSKLGWTYFYRKQISYYFFYYVAYCLLSSRKSIDFFINFLIIYTSLLALYACKQQWFGYADFEMRSILIGGERAYNLLFQGGFLRKFSTLSDPATSGVLFASVAMLCIILIWREKSWKRRRWLSLAIIANVLGYSYSGTRTSTLMIMAGIIFYIMATLYEKRTFIFLAISVLAFTFLILAPIHSSPVLERIRTTFQGTKDASAAIRDYDRHQVQPYIQAHPIGGGVYTCGMEGPVYNRGHYLWLFQPDSGYMKVLAEEGPIGLALLIISYFFVLRVGLRNFYRSKDIKIQNQYIALLTMLFTLMLAQYAQVAMSQYPIALMFLCIMVVFIKLAKYENEEVVESTNP